MRRQLLSTTSSAWIITLLVTGASAEEQRKNNRQLTNFGTDSFETTAEADTSVNFCRCEYPGENLYQGLQDINVGDYVILEDVMIMPSNHEACQNVLFVCPEVHVDGSPWSYQCPAAEEQQGQRRRANLRGVRLLEAYKRPYHIDDTPASANFGTAAHHLMDQDNGVAAGTDYVPYVVLSGNCDFCIEGGTILASSSITFAEECSSLELLFDKADDGRPMESGTFVSNEFLRTYGVKISAQSRGGAQNIYPMIIESVEVAFIDASIGNVLIPSRQSGAPSDDQNSGVLVFEFFEQTTVKSVSLVSTTESQNQLQVTQVDGTITDISFESVEPNGVQTILVDLQNVMTLAISFELHGAVSALDLCILPKSD